MDSPHNQSLADLDKNSLFHPVSSISDVLSAGPTIYSHGSGSTIYRETGDGLIDAVAGLWCVNVGYSRQELVDAGAEALQRLSFQHLFGGASAQEPIRVADRILSLFRDSVPGSDMARVFFGTSGSDANDTAVKLVRYYNNLRGLPRKKKIISRKGSYHGVTCAAGSLTGIESYHKAFDLPLDGVLHTSCPHYYAFAAEGESESAYTSRLIAELESLIAQEGADTIGAFIAEPVMGTGGVLIPPGGYFEKLQEVLDKHDILLIADEVITGFGRTGEWFACGTYSIRPDIVSLAKGLTSAYFPVSASVISNRIWDVLKDTSSEVGPFMHGFTYSGHPVGSAIALANLDVIEKERLPERAAVLGPVLLEALRTEVGDNPFVGDIRGVGLMAAVELVADRASRRPFQKGPPPHRIVAKYCAEAGVLTRALPYRHVLSFSPPLTITEAEIQEAANRFGMGLRRAMPELYELA